jgi:hypothetical protein
MGQVKYFPFTRVLDYFFKHLHFFFFFHKSTGLNKKWQKDRRKDVFVSAHNTFWVSPSMRVVKF